MLLSLFHKQIKFKLCASHLSDAFTAALECAHVPYVHISFVWMWGTEHPAHYDHVHKLIYRTIFQWANAGPSEIDTYHTFDICA